MQKFSKEQVKTAVMREFGFVDLCYRDLPELSENDVLVKVHACNICTSEYGVFNGSRKNRPFPLVFGHEWAGEVIDVGNKVKELKAGDHVACGYDFNPYSTPSKEGRTNDCPDISGGNILNSDGYYGNAGCAEFVVKNQTALYKISENVDYSLAGLLEPIGTVVSGLRNMNLNYGENVVIIGGGTMGILNALVARAHGFRVIISEMMPKKLETAKAYNFETIDASKEDVVESVKNMTDGEGADAVIVAFGSTQTTTQAFEILKKKRGKVLLFAAGYPSPEITIDSNEIHYRKISIIGAYGADYVDFKEAARLISQKAFDLNPIVENKYDLSEVNDAFEEAIEPGKYRICVTM